MRLAFSTNAYLNFSFPEAVSRLANIGYTGVEIMADVPHAWPAFLLDEQITEHQCERRQRHDRTDHEQK